jgi:hypothetical protein
VYLPRFAVPKWHRIIFKFLMKTPRNRYRSQVSHSGIQMEYTVTRAGDLFFQKNRLTVFPFRIYPIGLK